MTQTWADLEDGSDAPELGTPLGVYAYFLVPLPEPLGLPEGVPFPWAQYESDHTFLKRLAENPGGSAVIDEGPRPVREVSVMWHRVQALPEDQMGLMTLVEVAERVLPWAMGGRRPRFRYRVHRFRARRSQRREARRYGRSWLSTRDMTIAEVAVSVDVDAANMDDELTDALDAGLTWIRRIQEAHYVVRRRPISYCTRETLPPLIPFAIGRAIVGQLPEEVSGVGVFSVNDNMWHVVAEDGLTDDETLVLATALNMAETGHPFFGYLDSAREANLALHRRGDYRSAILAAATAAESMLDGLLLHALWEECTTPEDAAILFADPRSGVKSRTTRELAPRMGGNWDVNRLGPLRDWQNNIAAVRHRCIHSNYRPSMHEADTALNSLDELEQHIIERLVEDKTLARYPLTALALVGRRGLEKRELWRGKVRRAADDDNEPGSVVLFARWRKLVERQRLTTSGSAPPPDPARALLLAVIDGTGTPTWVLHDETAGLVARATPPTLDDMPEVAHGLTVLDDTVGTDADNPITVAWAEPTHDSQPTDDWRLDYHLLPEAAVMRDRSDPALTKAPPDATET